MRWLSGILISLVLLHFLLLGQPGVHACPSCAEAVPESSGADEDDRVREAQAYNWSIYLMVSMPYLLLGIVGSLVYRGLKVRPRAERLTSLSGQPDGERSPGCSNSSLDELS